MITKLTAALLFSVMVSMSMPHPRIDTVMNSGWKFTRENLAAAASPSYHDTSWESISLPHTWNAHDGQDGGSDYYRGVGWYRKTVILDKKWKAKRLYLKFDGAASSAAVYVNGTEAGRHKGNFGAFCFDITPHVRFDAPNVIAVSVSNAKDTTIAPLRGDFTVFGGIYRSVHLLVLDNISISPLDHASSGVYVTQKRVGADAAELAVNVMLLNRTAADAHITVRTTILDGKGKTASTAASTAVIPAQGRNECVQSITMPRPHLWNGRSDPYLYSVVVETFNGSVCSDRVVQPLGLRSFSVDAEKGFFLNGLSYRLHGVNRHQDRLDMGTAIGLKEHREDFRMIEEIGANAIRLAHYQHAQEFYSLCDSGGMVVWAEIPLVDDVNPSPEFLAVCKEQLSELIKQNYNHPSIIFWSLENELIPDADRELYGRTVRELNSHVKAIDSVRLTAVATRSKYKGDEQINSVTDVLGINVYRGWYEGTPDKFSSFIDDYHARTPERRLAITEYGAGASIAQHEVPAKKPDTKGPWHPEEWQAELHESTWKQMTERPYLWGTFVWNMFDFASDGRSEGSAPGRNDKGLVTYDRKVRKDAFYFYKAQWNPEPFVYITSRRYSERPAGTTEVKVYSTGGTVELFINGASSGEVQAAGKVFVWKSIRLAPGKNRVRAVSVINGKQYEDACEWTGIAQP
jgi:beta-galactosidase